MIRKLRKKFIIAAIIAVSLVLLVLIGAINILNFRNLAAEADNTLQILTDNNGAFPRQMFRAQDLLPSDQGNLSEKNTPLEEQWGKAHLSFGGVATENLLISPAIWRSGFPKRGAFCGSIWITLPL